MEVVERLLPWRTFRAVEDPVGLTFEIIMHPQGENCPQAQPDRAYEFDQRIGGSQMSVRTPSALRRDLARAALPACPQARNLS